MPCEQSQLPPLPLPSLPPPQPTLAEGRAKATSECSPLTSLAQSRGRLQSAFIITAQDVIRPYLPRLWRDPTAEVVIGLRDAAAGIERAAEQINPQNFIPANLADQLQLLNQNMETGDNQGGGTAAPVKSSCPKGKGAAASSEMVTLGERIGEMERRTTEKFAFPVGGVEVDVGLLKKKLLEIVDKAVMGLGKGKEVAEEEERLSRAFGEGFLFGGGR